MKLILALLGLIALANCEIVEVCKKEEVENCINGMTETFKVGQSESACRAAKNIKECLVGVINRCESHTGKAILQEQIDHMSRNAEFACANEDDSESMNEDDGIEDYGGDNGSGFTDEEEEIEECLDSEARFIAFVVECAIETSKDLQSRRYLYGLSLRDFNCKTFLSIALCVTLKVREVCGERVEVLFNHGVISTLPQSNALASPSPTCIFDKTRAEEYFKKSTHRPIVSLVKLMSMKLENYLQYKKVYEISSSLFAIVG